MIAKPYYVNKVNYFELFYQIKNLLEENFSHNDKIHNMDLDNYFKFNLGLQNKINELNFSKKFIDYNINSIKKFVGEDNLYYTPEVYLRAVRNQTDTNSEYIDCYSVWIPFVKITENNCLKYVDESRNKVKNNTEKVKNLLIDQYSPGHKLGLNYNNFKLKINNNNIKPMLLNDGEYIMFDGNLLHGGGQNKEEYIRIAINFFIIPSEKPINYYSDWTSKVCC